MKRSALPKRTTPLKKSTATIRAVNPEASAKRKKKYANYLRTATWRAKRVACIEAAGRRCEMTATGAVLSVTVRCPETTDLTAHHLTYARFGGNELPEDLRCYCRRCHRLLHSLQGKRVAA